jgi:hypothetical protein
MSPYFLSLKTEIHLESVQFYVMHVSSRRLTPIAEPTRIESHDAKERARCAKPLGACFNL